MGSRKVEFPGHAGDQLAARLDLPATVPRCFALFAHCFTCGKDIFAASRISAELARLGVAVLRFDFTGLGMSEGEFANTDFSSNVQDLIAAADYLRREHAAPALLVGHSLGGAAVLAAAGDIDEVRAVVTIGAPAEPSHLTHLLHGAIDELRAGGRARIDVGGRPFTLSGDFLHDIESTRLHDRIAALKRALLIMHSPADAIVGIDQAQKIYAAARHPKSFVSLDQADHLLRRKADGRYVAQVLAAWAERYLPDMPADEALPEGVVEVAETGAGRFTGRARAGSHAWLVDEPVAAGGDDAGPAPYEQLLGALGSCTVMTLRMYARHKDLPLERVSVRLRHRQIHAEDCADCETREGRIDEIERELVLEGALSDAQRERMLEIANRCPVHRTLEAKARIRTHLR